MKEVVFIITLFSMFVVANGKSNDARSTRKHASDFLGITKDTEPPYDVFNNLVKNMDSYLKFTGILVSFADTNDIEDEVGIGYLAKFYRHYCPSPSTEDFEKLSLFEQTAVTELFGFPQTVFLKAKNISSCLYHKD